MKTKNYNQGGGGNKNYTAVLDRCAQEQFYFWKIDSNVDVYNFLENKGWKFVATEQSFRELVENPTGDDLFSSYLSAQVQSGSQNIDYDSMVISKADGSITSGLFENGYKLKIESANVQLSQTPLWDSYAPFRRAAKKEADKSNIYYARENGNCLVLTNDNDQIKAIGLTLNYCLRPADLLVWMVIDEYITRQKAVWVYKKTKERDVAWVPKDMTFAEYFRKTKLNFDKK